MRFTVLSHAGLHVEHAGTSLVFDPWLVGSCYWRSWWNFPEPSPELVASLRPDFIYLTHLHWDHFHGPSLKRIVQPHTRFLVPRVPNGRMLRDLQSLGYFNIIEIPHGSQFRLGDDFDLWSWQLGPNDDSAACVVADGVTLLNANDCKLFGATLTQVVRRFPRVDFVFKSHSSASAVPHCIEDHERLLPGMRDAHHYIDAFCEFAVDVKARHAIPFASSHCYLHDETRRFNQLAVLPTDVRKRFADFAAERSLDAECVVMPAGSAWDSRDGFDIVEFDYANAADLLDDYAWQYSEKLFLQADLERDERPDWAAFESYFDEFLKALPPLSDRLLTRDVAFKVPADGESSAWWTLSFRSRSITVMDRAPDDAIVITTPPLVLNHCTRVRMFSAWTPSKRLSIRLADSADLKPLLVFLTALDLFELDALPLRRLFSWRSLTVRLTRWREYLDYARHALRRRNPFVADS